MCLPNQCIKILISGRVQGVFFRGSTRIRAIQLGISGYAKNLAEGKVEVLACGNSESLNNLINWLHIGPEYANVTAVEVSDVQSTNFSDFSIS